MKKHLLSAFLILSTTAFAQNFQIKSGWQLKGTENTYPITKFNQNCIDIIWKYDSASKQWQGYSPNEQTSQTLKNYQIPAITELNPNDGFWIKANEECNFSVTNLPITNIKDYLLDASKVYIKDNNVYLSNIKIISSDTDINDSVDMVYTINPNNLNLEPVTDKIKIYKDLGIFNEEGDIPLFVKDVPHDIYMTDSDDDSNVSMDVLYNITVEKDKTKFYFDLVAGQVISFLIQEPSDDYIFKIYSPEGEEIYKFEGAASYGVISDAIAIKEPGKYTVTVTPATENTMSLKMMFLNANRRDLTNVVNGDHIYVSFENNIRDYAKYKVFLNSSDKLSLSKPSDSNIELVLLDENGKMIADVTGLPLIYTAEKTGNYYIFIFNSKGWGSYYSGDVEIESSTQTYKLLKTVNKTTSNASVLNITPAK